MGVNALRHGEAERARHERLRLVDREIILVVTALGADIEDITESFGGDQCGLRAPAFDHGVGCKRGAMDEYVDVTGVKTGVGQNETHPVQHGLFGMNGGRQYLARLSIPTDIQHDIRERTSDIDGKPYFGSVKHYAISKVWLVKEVWLANGPADERS